jgi:hypothetical protein
MGELRRMLDSVSVTARVEHDAFGALERRRRRKERNRRIRAGVMAFTFAAAGIGGVVFAFNDERQAPISDSVPTAGPPESPELQDPTGTMPPDLLEVTCTEKSMKLGSTEVQPQTDGVHIRIDNREGPGAFWEATLLGREDGRFDTFGNGLEPGVNTIVHTFPPGPIFVNCFTGSLNASEITRDDLVRIDVRDPNGLWVSDRLACDRSVNAKGFQADAGATSPHEPDPEQAIRLHVPGVQATDKVIPAEYGVRQHYAWMIVRRGSESLARFQVVAHGNRWGVHFGDTCAGSGIAEG